MKTVLLLILLCCAQLFTKAGNRHSDSSYPTYNLKQDEHWIDSLKQIIKKATRHYEAEGYWEVKAVPRFKSSCLALARYYERMYDSGKLANMSRAIAYYTKLSDVYYDIGGMSIENGDNADVYDIAAMFRKLADIYYKGKGVKKDLAKSLELALDGTGNIDGLFAFYSKRYFKSLSLVFPLQQQVNDSLFSCAANPFAVGTKIKSWYINDPLLRKIARSFNAMNENGTAYIEIAMSGLSRQSMRSETYYYRFMTNARDYLTKQLKIKPEYIKVRSLEDSNDPINYPGYKLRHIAVSIRKGVVSQTRHVK